MVRNELNSSSNSVTETFVLSVLSTTNFLQGDNNSITITYDLSGIPPENLNSLLIHSKQIFHLDTGSVTWGVVGGSVDMLAGTVSATISDPGVFAAFTTDIVTDVSDDNTILSKIFALGQNFPNPFNPITKIRFSIP